jgi:hypothetical protein
MIMIHLAGPQEDRWPLTVTQAEYMWMGRDCDQNRQPAGHSGPMNLRQIEVAETARREARLKSSFRQDIAGSLLTFAVPG